MYFKRRPTMFRVTAFVVLFSLINVEAANDENYVFYFRRAGFFDTEALRMLPEVDREVESLSRKIEVNCRFVQAAQEYEQLQKAAPTCVTPRDRENLKNARSGFQAARDECVSKAVCKSELEKAVIATDKAISYIDAAGYQKVWIACKDNNLCKYNAYIDMHNDIFKLYLLSRPQLRLLADRGVASLECGLAIVNCMSERNEKALRSMYEGAARLKECQGCPDAFASASISIPNRVSGNKRRPMEP